jgi:K+-transporting ATPase KdpF subunit
MMNDERKSEARIHPSSFKGAIMEILVGIIGLILIVYLVATIVWPERF